MTIRGLSWLALLFAAAVALAMVGHFDTGQVLFIYPPHRIDIALNFFVVALIVLFLLLYALLRITRNLWRMPQRVAAYRARAREAKAHNALREAVGNFFAGRFSRAEKAARDSLASPANKSAASLIAAVAAHRMHEYARRDEWLASIDAPDWQDARLMTVADLRVDSRDADGAMMALAEIQAQGGRRIYAQQIALRAQQLLQNWDEVLKIVKTLEKRDALHPAVASRLRLQAVENLLRERRHDPSALLGSWYALSASERQSPRLADLVAQWLVDLNKHEDARKIVEEALQHHWEPRLLLRYPDTAGDALSSIQKAEAWRAEHPKDAYLSFALGRLCVQQKLWGKAQVFLEQALKQATDDAKLTCSIHCALARLFEQLGDTERAAQHYRTSALARGMV